MNRNDLAGTYKLEMKKNNARLLAAPYLRLARRIVGGRGTPESVAFEKEILCAAESVPVALPVFLPDHLQRITSGTDHESVKNEIESILAPTYAHAATIAYHLKDVIISDGSVYAANMRHFVAASGPSAKPELRHLKSGALVSTATGCKYFGHWLREDCTEYMLAQPTTTPICITGNLTSHQNDYARIFEQDWSSTEAAIVDHLVIYQDFGQNSLKRARYQQLADRIAQAYPEAKRDKLIFLKRGETGMRRLIENEDVLLDALTKRGFEIVDVQDSLDDILKALRRAKLIVSMEGSQITHSIYALAHGCGLLVLEPPDRFTATHRHWSTCRGVRFGFVVGQFGEQGYRYSESEILRVTDMLLAASERTEQGFMQG